MELQSIKFNGYTIPFISKDGEYWIPIKTMCNALGVDGTWHIKSIKKDLLFGQLWCDHTTVGADNRQRQMVCLPEKWIYGWIASIQFTNTMNPQTKANLIAYKKECYEVLYNHFHGILAKRQSMLLKKEENLQKMRDIAEQIKQDELSQQLNELKNKNKKIESDLKTMDLEMISRQYSLF